MRPSWPLGFAIGAGTRDRRKNPSQASREGEKDSVRGEKSGSDVRMLIDETAAVVDLVVNDHVQVLLRVVGGDLREGELLGRRHGEW